MWELTRRKFFGNAMLGGASVIGGAMTTMRPTSAESISINEAPKRELVLLSSFPDTMDILSGAMQRFVSLVEILSQGNIQITVSPPGEIVSGSQVLDAVANSVAPFGFSLSHFNLAKDPAFAIPSCLPFGLTSRMHDAWQTSGEGKLLYDELFAGHNLLAFPMGNTGAQMGGWFRKEVNNLNDINGLRMRVGGVAARVLSQIGVQPVSAAGYALQEGLVTGSIDAAEWLNPYDDFKIGLDNLAPFYYFPAFWEPGVQFHLFINREFWADLDEVTQHILQVSSAMCDREIVARYDIENPAALTKILHKNVQLRVFPQDVLDASLEQANLFYRQLSDASPMFSRIYNQLVKFRRSQYEWYQVAEHSMADFMVEAYRRQLL